MGLLQLREAETIVEAMNSAKGNYAQAAKILGVTRQGLRGKIKRLKLKLRPYFKNEK